MPNIGDVVLAAETLAKAWRGAGRGDPIIEAEKRGSIMAIIRLGNKDLQRRWAQRTGRRWKVLLAGYNSGLGGGCGPMGCGGMGPGCGPGGCGPAVGIPPGYVAGVTAPMYGMPMCGTPIGLAGPPHIPLGVPAGLQEHSITNYTHYSIPEPVHDVRIKVAEFPGLSYPTPPHRAVIIEVILDARQRVTPPACGGIDGRSCQRCQMPPCPGELIAERSAQLAKSATRIFELPRRKAGALWDELHDEYRFPALARMYVGSDCGFLC